VSALPVFSRPALLAVLATLAAGCAPDRLVLRAAHELECASNKLQVASLDDGRIRISGCGETVTYLCAPSSQGEEKCRMIRPRSEQIVQETAARDYRCEAPVQVDPAEGGNFLAVGCGRKELYRCEGAPRVRCQNVGRLHQEAARE
jgi:hypothetical protein